MEDERLVQYERERAELAAAIEKAVAGQYIGTPPPLLTGWSERAVAAVVTAGWLPPAAVAERVAAAVRAAAGSSPLAGEAATLALVSPAGVSRYLAAQGWQREQCEPGVREVWSLAGRARVMLPLNADYVDYGRRFLETLRTLTEVLHWDAAQLAANIAPYDD